ncbi:hypothetical protein A3D70_02080 [Candidatus Adlerbacteria bacterium RIFCSPHIGHO2_02_FULL_54_18]|uniref:Zinc finger DksA/TraR C4-type domain-containing protein n=2 Tax=Candidatus Adleribacteriota TaxID=1752736 RepID=A0A1F4Y6U8_9BACT|nr:MAG: hypothetical protein A2949_01360 [Candidatus Adlerbacteria bacterium RIFCSPLOWO2_01_FULL_54_21b]OGC88993.1 MAG: hypothetical protein A3D70_02080 [Candidatus Adlerbacteria bacterium RIFCSPHIGHO2_02_FULL_54_18]
MNTEHFKQKLEEEQERVEQELKELGHEDIDPAATESDELADRMEEFGEHQAEIATLTARRREVVVALERIKNGTYGVCEISGDVIEEDRLEANPAARTCTKHL